MLVKTAIHTKTTRTTTVTVDLSEIRKALNLPEGAQLLQALDRHECDVCYDRSLEDTHQLVFTHTETEETSE